MLVVQVDLPWIKLPRMRKAATTRLQFFTTSVSRSGCSAEATSLCQRSRNWTLAELVM